MDTIAFDSPEQVRLGTLGSHCSTRFNHLLKGHCRQRFICNSLALVLLLFGDKELNYHGCPEISFCCSKTYHGIQNPACGKVNPAANKMRTNDSWRSTAWSLQPFFSLNFVSGILVYYLGDTYFCKHNL